MAVGILKDCVPDERRVALVPEHVASVQTDVFVEAGAGAAAGFDDGEYRQAGASVASRAEVCAKASAVAVINAAAEEQWRAVQPSAGQLVVGYCAPYARAPFHALVAAQRASAFAVEAIPRITRAQSMDVLSSMANISGYKAVLLAASHVPKLFPLMMTAAGTIVPSKVLVLGAGVAGLQAIATAKRLGAVVSAYDIRSEVKEQIQSLGAHFVELPLDVASGAGEGGYAKEMDADFYARQQELMSNTVAESDVLICTAAVPGRKAPRIITKEMVQRMHAGSVIVDIAAMSGGNCAYTQPDETVEVGGVRIMGPTDLPSTVAQTASRLYSKNMSAIFGLVLADGAVRLNIEDEIVAGALVIADGEVRTEELRG